MRPGVASEYLKEVIEDFEQYAKANYVPKLEQKDADPDLLLAGVAYVGTRDLPGHEWQLREVFDRRVPRDMQREMDTACIRALLETTENPVEIARFLSRAATGTRTRASARTCEQALVKMGPTASEALLSELAHSHHDTQRARRLATILQKVSKVPPPEPVGTWSRRDAEFRDQVIAEWRERIAAAGGLPAPERDDDTPDDSPEVLDLRST